MLIQARASLVRTCMSPTMPAQAAPILSVMGNTFFADLLMTKLPYAYRRSDASSTPFLQTMPMGVVPGTYGSLLIRKDGGRLPSSRFKASEARAGRRGPSTGSCPGQGFHEERGARKSTTPGVEKSMLIFEKESYECRRTHFRVSTVPRAPRSGSKPYFLQDLDDSGFEPNAC